MSLDQAIHHTRNRAFKMAVVEAMPERVFARVYNRISDPKVSLRPVDDGAPGQNWEVTTPSRKVRTVRAQDALRVTHIGNPPESHCLTRYTLPGRVEPREGDHVVDVGSFIGEYAWQSIEFGNTESAVAIEPDPRNTACLHFNVPDEVEVVEAAAYYKNSNTTMNLGSVSTDSGILPVDKGKSNQVTVETRRLDNIVDAVDLLKVEAEGLEPEVLLGLGNLNPDRIVVNVSAERYSESPVDICEGILLERGYETYRDYQKPFGELYGWKK